MYLNSQSLNYEYEHIIIVLAVFNSCRLFSVVYCALAPALSTSVTASRVPSTIVQTVETSLALLNDSSFFGLAGYIKFSNSNDHF